MFSQFPSYFEGVNDLAVIQFQHATFEKTVMVMSEKKAWDKLLINLYKL